MTDPRDSAFVPRATCALLVLAVSHLAASPRASYVFSTYFGGSGIEMESRGAVDGATLGI